MLFADASNWTAAAGTLVLGVVTAVALWQTRTHARLARQPHVVPRLGIEDRCDAKLIPLVNDGQGLARNARLALRLPDSGDLVRSTFASLGPGESKSVELITSGRLAWGGATGCALAEDLAGEEWVVPFAILEEHAGATARLYVSAGKISRARHLDPGTRELVHYLRHPSLEHRPRTAASRLGRIFGRGTA